MIRKIIQIDEESCNGCGLCAKACHEGAIGMVDGKAKLLRDDYCDGLGDCLPVCPVGAITFVEREGAAYDEAAVLENRKKQEGKGALSFGCPGSRSKQLLREDAPGISNKPKSPGSELCQWPVQIKLAPVHAPYFQDAELLIAADCSAYAYANFHQDFIRGRVTLIGCPKLDAGDYSDKLSEIFRCNAVKSVTVVRMEVPCCGGIEFAAEKAVKSSGRHIPLQVVTVSTDGCIL